MLANLQKTVLGLAVGCLLSAPLVCASEVEPGVARISLMNGDISTMRGDSGDWAAAAINAPIVSGDKILSGSKSRTELQLDYANILRLAGNTNVRVAELSRSRIQIQVAEGLVNYMVLKGNEVQIEINTPNVAIRPLKEGIYRIEVNLNAQTELIVRKGEAEVSTSRGNTLVKKNQIITIQGVEDPMYQVAKAPEKDAWDEWNQDRNKVIQDARSYRYANTYYTGLHELDRYGSWIQVDGYDWVWCPTVDPYWTPYYSGRWVWGGYWGWTWCSSEPWGWAPYHYGRWFNHHNRWCWWPGPVAYGYRPMWAPAYVSFLGFGFGGHNWSFGFGFGFNSVGWIPTGPCDYYHPWWGHRNSYNVVNVTNITNIRNVYNINSARAVGPLADSRRYPRISNVENVANDPRLQNGIVTTRTEDFGRGRGNARYRQGDGMDLKNAQLVAGTPPVVPTQDSLKASDQPARITAASARANATERYFTRNQPQAQPVSFQNQAAGVQQMVQTANPLNTPSRVESTERARARQVGGTAAGGSAETMNAPAASRTAAPASASPVSERGQSDRSNRGVGMVNSGNNPTAPAAPSAAPVAGSEKGRSGWSRAGDAAAGSAGSSQPAIQASPPASGEAARRSGWTRFGEGRSTPPPPAAPSMAPPVNGGVSRRLDSHPSEAATPVSPATSRPSPADSRLGERFPVSRGSGVESRSSTAPASPAPERPQRFERAVPGDPPARVNSTPPSWGRERITSSRPEYPPSTSRQETHSTPRSEAPVYQDRRQSSESPRVERPQLQIERPVVTERSAPRGYDGGSRAERQAPSSPPPQSSGRGDRGQSRR